MFLVERQEDPGCGCLGGGRRMYREVYVGNGEARMDWGVPGSGCGCVCVCTCAWRNGDAAGAVWGLRAPARAQPQLWEKKEEPKEG